MNLPPFIASFSSHTFSAFAKKQPSIKLAYMHCRTYAQIKKDNRLHTRSERCFGMERGQQGGRSRPG